MATAIAATSTHQSKRLILVLLILVALPSLYYSVSVGQDWYQFYRPATLALLHGQNPYGIHDFHNAPWH